MSKPCTSGAFTTGIDVFRDTAALVRAVATGDGAGVHAVSSSSDSPRHLACAAATFAYYACVRMGLSPAEIDQLTREFSSVAIDNLLDAPHKWTGEEVA